MAQEGTKFVEGLKKLKAERMPQTDKGGASGTPLQTIPPSSKYVDVTPPIADDKKSNRKDRGKKPSSLVICQRRPDKKPL